MPDTAKVVRAVSASRIATGARRPLEPSRPMQAAKAARSSGATTASAGPPT
jgi:hypothetical protein